jgi:hypothetical protein
MIVSSVSPRPPPHAGTAIDKHGPSKPVRYEALSCDVVYRRRSGERPKYPRRAIRTLHPGAAGRSRSDMLHWFA